MSSKWNKLNIKKDFMYGLVVILPVFSTIWLVMLSIEIFAGPVSSLFGQNIPHLASFILTLILITLIGIIARNVIGKIVLRTLDDVMHKIPIVNIVYKSIKQVLASFSFQEKLMSAVLVEYPRKGLWAIGFITKDDPHGVIDKSGKDRVKGMCSVFIPTTPNPTSGYFLYADPADLVPLHLSIEESVKLVMSAGVLTPDSSIQK